MMKWISLLALILTTQVWADPAPSPALQPPSIPIINLMTNGSFEASKAAWSNSGGTFSINTSTPLNGKASGAFLPSGSGQSLSSAQYPIKEGLKGGPCTATILYKTAELTNSYTFQVVDGSSNVLGYVQLPSAASVANRQSVPFRCSTSGTMGIQILSSGSAAAILVDDITLGTNPLFQVSQATYYGGVSVVAGCDLANSGSVGYSDFSDSGSCAGETLLGHVTSFASTGNGQVNFSDLPPGEYEVVFQGQFHTAGVTTNSDMVITDGTTIGTPVSLNFASGTSSAAPATVRAHFTYLTAGPRFFKLEGSGNVAHGLLMNGGEAISIYRFPNQTEIAARPEVLYWDADLKFSGANPSIGVTTHAAQEVTDAALTATNSGSLQAQVPCSGTNASTGLTCSSGDPGYGIVVNVPRTGRVEVCADFTNVLQPSGSSGALYTAFKVVETTNSTQTILTESQNQQSGGFSGSQGLQYLNGYHVCGQFTLASAGTHTFRLFNQTVASGAAFTANSLALDSNPGSSNSNARFTVRPIDQQVLAPVLSGSVMNPSTGVTNTCAGKIAAGGGSILSSTGNCLASITYNATGDYTLAFAPGTWAVGAEPICQCAASDTSFSPRCNLYAQADASNVRIQVASNVTATDSVISTIQCIGQK